MIDKLIKPVGDILDKFVADKDLKTKLSHELEKEIISLRTKPLNLISYQEGSYFFIDSTLSNNEV